MSEEQYVFKTTMQVRMAINLLKLLNLKKERFVGNPLGTAIYTSEAITYLSGRIKHFKSSTFRDFLDKLIKEGVVSCVPDYRFKDQKGCWCFTETGKERLKEELADLTL